MRLYNPNPSNHDYMKPILHQLGRKNNCIIAEVHWLFKIFANCGDQLLRRRASARRQPPAVPAPRVPGGGAWLCNTVILE